MPVFKRAILKLCFFTLIWQNAAAVENGTEKITEPDNSTVQADENVNDEAIQPYRHNPWYWEYRGEPIMLIGASDRDNLWQWTGDRLIEQLDLIESVGGNYVCNTMSDRNEGDTFAAKEIRFLWKVCGWMLTRSLQRHSLLRQGISIR